MEVRVVPKYLKCMGHTTPPSQITHYYYERELSFDKTPLFNVKMYRPSSMRFHIPCLNPRLDFEDDVHDFQYDNGTKSSLMDDDDKEEEEEEEEEEAEIDKRAEEFIAKFYQQMKLQRQMSYLQYNETPNWDYSSWPCSLQYLYMQSAQSLFLIFCNQRDFQFHPLLSLEAFVSCYLG